MENEQLANLKKGLLEFAVLESIGAKKAYTAEIIARLEPTMFAAGEGTLYPLLSRLKRDGMLSYDWVESPNGPPRKYYTLTVSGKQHLQALRQYWRELGATLAKLGGKHE